MIRKFLKFRPALINGFVLLWAFHFSFGISQHYHPDYAHAHDGEVQAHSHGGHFHSLELELLARFIDAGGQPLHPGGTHHHSESLPGSDPETIQYNFNHSGVTKVKLAVDFNLNAAPVAFHPTQPDRPQSLIISSGIHRVLLVLQSPSERSPPLRV